MTLNIINTNKPQVQTKEGCDSLQEMQKIYTKTAPGIRHLGQKANHASLRLFFNEQKLLKDGGG